MKPGTKHWTRSEKSKLKALYLVKSDAQIADELGRSLGAIQQKRSALRLKKSKKVAKQVRGGASPLKSTDLAVAQSVLRQLGYEITITKTSN